MHACPWATRSSHACCLLPAALQDLLATPLMLYPAGSRMQQVVHWLSPEEERNKNDKDDRDRCLIVLDECHRAKNLLLAGAPPDASRWPSQRKRPAIGYGRLHAVQLKGGGRLTCICNLRKERDCFWLRKHGVMLQRYARCVVQMAARRRRWPSKRFSWRCPARACCTAARLAPPTPRTL